MDRISKGAQASGVVFDSAWESGDVLRYKHRLYFNGYSSGSVWTGRGSKGGGNIVPTNAVLSVLNLLSQLPPSDSKASLERRISIEWGSPTNRQHRTYDRTSPPRELLEIHVASNAGFDQPVHTLKVRQEHEFVGLYATLSGVGTDKFLVGRERASLWDWKTGQRVYSVDDVPETRFFGGDHPVRIAASPSGHFTYARSQKVSLHDLSNGRELWSHFEPERLRGDEFTIGLQPGHVCLTPDGSTIVVAVGTELRRYSRADGTNFVVIGRFGRGVVSLASSADGRFIAAAGGPLDPVELGLAESAGKGRELAAQSFAFTHVRLLKLDGTPVASFPQPREVLSLAFSPDSRWLAVLCWTRWEVRLYDMTTLALDGTMPVWVHGGMRFNDLNQLVWSPDGRFLALSGKGLRAVVCDMHRRLPVAQSEFPVTSQVCFTSDSAALIGQRNGEKLCIFDLSAFR